MRPPEAPLVCPSCGTSRPPHERFCPDCGMPLVIEGALGADTPVSDVQDRARKIKPQYSEGELVRVARANHQAEAELIQGLLLEEGVPSMTRRARGFDVPDMLAAGPRDVMVPASGAVAAREALLAAELIAPADPEAPADVARAARVLGGLLAAVVLVAIVLWIGTELIG